jgi:biopolymer transport protein TolR
MVAGSSRGVKNDINVTPLVDVVLVLLIIFMVVTPMLQRGKDVHLPQANKLAKEEKNGDPLVVSVTADRRIWVESVGFAEAAIEEKLGAELAKEPNRRILLKGDQSVTVGDVRKVMDHAKKAGARAVELAIEEIKK